MRTSALLKLVFAFCLGFPCLAAANAELVASLNISADVEGFGGFSGLEISGDGTEITAVSDKGRIMRGYILRDANNDPIGVSDMRFAYVLGPDGARMRKWREDAEGLAIDNRGRLYVSFEGAYGDMTVLAAPRQNFRTRRSWIKCRRTLVLKVWRWTALAAYSHSPKDPGS